MNASGTKPATQPEAATIDDFVHDVDVITGKTADHATAFLLEFTGNSGKLYAPCQSQFEIHPSKNRSESYVTGRFYFVDTKNLTKYLLIRATVYDSDLETEHVTHELMDTGFGTKSQKEVLATINNYVGTKHLPNALKITALKYDFSSGKLVIKTTFIAGQHRNQMYEVVINPGSSPILNHLGLKR